MAAFTVSMFSRRGTAALILAWACLAIGPAAFAQRQKPADPKKELEQRSDLRRARPLPVRTPSAELFFCETRDVQCRTSINTFDLDGVRDLFLFAAWRNVTGEHTQQLRLVLPDGNTYQTLETKFTADTSSADPDVQVAVRSRDDRAVNVPLAVAGTHITQRSLDGTWTVELFLDGKFITRTTLIFRPRGTRER